MDSPVSAQEPDHGRIREPRRLSALYQYHNAPEVAPAHGIEYDDTIYTSSDKMTVVREFPFRHHHYHGKHAFDRHNRPPRIIFGMKVGTFLIVAGIVLLIVVGTAVGGAVGGKNLSKGYTPTTVTSNGASASSSIPSTTSSISTYSAPTPTYTPLSDCPKSNNTMYMTLYPTSAKPDASNQTFTKFCDMVPKESTKHISGTFVYSFSDCADLCASFNFASGKMACNVASYLPSVVRPSLNCWIGYGPSMFSSLAKRNDTDTAILLLVP